ncbi:uncharacterized protein LOC110857950 isoform X2 [Folsomia candida]|uniref:uncharacterized protein LOC110857950 isoform X2 n=1 Tax=Folsomia candida TaxID=158441 RepID=UPI000B8FA7DB|nr:uncharacterized protein LOC110857950 isoform X2 [Folsomia candida]
MRGHLSLLRISVVLLFMGYAAQGIDHSRRSPRLRRLSHRLFPQFQAYRPDCTFRNGFYPNLADCHTYFLCRNGRAYPFKCPFPSQFFPEKRICVWTGSLSCPAEEKTTNYPDENKTTNVYNTDEASEEVFQAKTLPLNEEGVQEDSYAKGSNAQTEDTGNSNYEVITTQSLPDYHPPEVTETYYKSRAYTVSSHLPSTTTSASSSSYSSQEEQYSQDTATTSPATTPIHHTLPANPSSSSARDTAPDTSTVLKLWMTHAFISSFTKYVAPHTSEVALGEKVYARLGDPTYLPIGVSSILQNLPIQEAQLLVDFWYLQGLIPKTEHTAESKLLSSSSKFINTIREHLVFLNSGEVTYGITGIIQLSSSKTGSDARVTMLRSFKKFKLEPVPVLVSYSRGDECIMWGQFCKTRLILDELDQGETDALLSYMRTEALTQFAEENFDLVEKIKKEAIRNIKGLPKDVQAAVGKVIRSGGNRPDQVLSVSHLNGDTLGL